MESKAVTHEHTEADEVALNLPRERGPFCWICEMTVRENELKRVENLLKKYVKLIDEEESYEYFAMDWLERFSADEIEELRALILDKTHTLDAACWCGTTTEGGVIKHRA